MVLVYSFIMILIVALLDNKTLKNGKNKEKMIYYSILILFILASIVRQLKIDIINPFEWGWRKITFIKQFYLFLENKG